MKIVLANAFSLNMLSRMERTLKVVPISAETARRLVIDGGATCAIGHPDTAKLVALLLGLPDRANEWAGIAETRPNVVLDEDTLLIVAQYTGPRLPAGAIELPEGASIEFWLVYDVYGQRAPKHIKPLKMLNSAG